MDVVCSIKAFSWRNKHRKRKRKRKREREREREVGIERERERKGLREIRHRAREGETKRG